MRSKLYTTLVELQTLKQSPALEILESSSVSSGKLEKKRPTSSTTASDTPLPSDTPSKRPRRSCVGKKLYYTDKDAEDECNQKDEKKTNHDEKDEIDLTASFDNDSKLPVKPVASLPISAVIRLEHKKFNLAGKKRKDLVIMCKAEGIDCIGTDGDMKDRLKRFAEYWRSECDREVQKSKEQMLSNFKQQEASRSGSVIDLCN